MANKDRIATVLEGLGVAVEIRYHPRREPRYLIMTQYLPKNVVVEHNCLTTATRLFCKAVREQTARTG